MSHINFNYNPQNTNINSPGYFSNYFSEEFNKHDFSQFDVPEIMIDNTLYQNMSRNQARPNDALSDSNSSTNHSSKHSPEYLTDNHSALEVRDETDMISHSKTSSIIRKGIQKQYETLIDNNVEYRYEDDPNEYKKARKRMQNRESASRVRSKKKVYVDDLENEMTIIRQENTELRVENAALRAENNLLKQQTCFLERMAMKNGQQPMMQPMPNPPNPVLARQQSFEECLLPLVNKEQQASSKKMGYIRTASPHTFKKHAILLGVFTALLCTYGLVPQEGDKGDLLYAGNINEFKNSFSIGVKSVGSNEVGRASVPGYHMDLDQSLAAMLKMNQEYNFVKSAVKVMVILAYVIYFIYVILITNWKYVFRIKNTKIL